MFLIVVVVRVADASAGGLLHDFDFIARGSLPHTLHHHVERRIDGGPVSGQARASTFRMGFPRGYLWTYVTLPRFRSGRRYSLGGLGRGGRTAPSCPEPLSGSPLRRGGLGEGRGLCPEAGLGS